MKQSDSWKHRGPLCMLGLLLAILIVCPLVMIFVRVIIPDGHFDLSGAQAAVLDRDNLNAIFNSLVLGACVTALPTAIAAPLAYLFARTSLARARWLDIVSMIPFMTPPYIASMGWILFTQKEGLFQQLFPGSGSTSKGFFSFGGLVLTMSLHVFLFMLTVLKSAMSNTPASLEESGTVFGAGSKRRPEKIFMPLLSGNYTIAIPSVFVKTLSEYGMPSVLRRRTGFCVFTTDIHRHTTTAPVDFGKATSLSSVLVGICLALWRVQNYITVKKNYRLVSRKGSRSHITELKGGKGFLAWSYVIFVLVVAVGIPYFPAIFTSLTKLRGYGLAAGNFTVRHYVDSFIENPKRCQALINSLGLAAGSAIIAAVLGTMAATAIRRSSRRAGKVLEAVSLLPEMLPGIVLVVGIMLFWNATYKVVPPYNTIGIMIPAYMVLLLPYTIQYIISSFTQINDNLIWVGRTSGGASSYVFLYIILPLIMKGVAIGWMMTFIIVLRELVAASLIAPPNTLVIPTFIMREFEQGSVSAGMAMAVLCMLFTIAVLVLLSLVLDRRR